MEAGTGEDQDSALRPLRNVATTTASLRAGSMPEHDTRTAVVQVAAAVEMSLRRMLRDLPTAALQVRLRALAPDELRADEVLAELRQHDQISIELAAAVHDLLEVRHRLREHAPLSPHDATLAYHVADRLEHEASRPRQPAPPAPSLALGDDDIAPVSSPARRRPRRGRLAEIPRNTRLAIGGGLLAILAILGIWWALPGDSGVMEEGVALFRSGSYEEAADRFGSYAQAHPDDPTPRLYLARIHRRMARPQLAVAQLDTALRLAPEDPDVHTELGFLLIDTGHPAEAVDRFRAALSFDPQSESAWIGLVTALREAGRPDAAERVLERAPTSIRGRLAAPADSMVMP
ncbi:MAG TPA: tetratricopeptide repeat protein [Longimicrobiaceae bacterium]